MSPTGSKTIIPASADAGAETARARAAWHNLPVAHGPLLGRDTDLSAVHSLVLSARLVTVAGTGGIGKTRLALAAAQSVAAAINLGAGWQFFKNDNFGFRADYSGYANFYDDYNTYNVIDQSITLEPQYFMVDFVFSLPTGYNYVMEDQETFQCGPSNHIDRAGVKEISLKFWDACSAV